MLKNAWLQIGPWVLTLGGSVAAQDGCILPPAPDPLRWLQPDGSTVEVLAQGSAASLWFLTEGGLPALERDGVLYHALPDSGGLLRPTPHRVGEVDPRAAGLPARFPGRWHAPALPPRADLHPALTPARTRSARAPRRSAATAGTVQNLVVLLRFTGHGLQPFPDALPGRAEGAHRTGIGATGQNRLLSPAADISVIMNAPGGDPVLAPTGSVRDHYLENSYGQLVLESTVVGWVDVPGSEAFYANGNSGLTTRTWRLIADALDAVDPLVDFRQFDVDADGRIDAITFLHSGYGAEFVATDQYGTSFRDRIWSHRWSIPPWTSAEGVQVSDYHISPGLWGISGSQPGRIGVICHETGHFFGLPDLYDTDGSSDGIGNWCLMAGGAWGFDGSQRFPSHMSAWCKVHMGWARATALELLGPGMHTLAHIEEHPAVLKVQGGYPPGEYLLLENKKPVGFDAVIPQAGLLVWHVDEAKGDLPFNDVNQDEGFPGQPGWPASGSHYRVALLAADGEYGLEQDFGRGDAGDPYHEGGQDRLDSTTVPGTDTYQHGVVTVTGNALDLIANSGNDVHFRHANDHAPRLAAGELPPAVAGQPYEVLLSATGGTAPRTFSELLAAPDYVLTDLGASQFAATGIAQGWQADDAVFELTLPFAFPFYGDSYDQVFVSSNGFLDFVAVAPGPFNDSADLRYTPRIAPLWDDLVTFAQPGHDIYVDQGVTGEVTIRWEGEEFLSGFPVNVAVTLVQDGTIRFHYGPGNLSLTPTVGISAGQDGAFLLTAHDGAPQLPDAHSLQFQRLGSALPPGFTLDASGLLSGTPAAAGSFAFLARVRDAELRQGVEEFTLAVMAAPPAQLALAAYPAQARLGDVLSFRHSGGTPGNPVLFTVSAVNQQSAVLAVAAGQLDAFGVWPFTVPADYVPDVAGSTVTFTAIEVGAGFVTSNPVDVSFE